jgi:hypothetical protein
VLVDGSFVSNRLDPKDVDVLLGLRPGSMAGVLHHPNGRGHVKQLSGHFAGFVDGRHALHVFVDEIGGSIYRSFSQFFRSSTRAGEPAIKGILLVEVRS